MADDDTNVVGFPQQGPSTPSRGEMGGIGSTTVTATTSDGTEVSVNADGSVEIFKPAVITQDWSEDEFNANLAERLDDGALGNIASEIIEGVENDIQTRSELIDQYTKGLDLLGTRIEEVSSSSASRSISRIGHPLLIESMVKGHAGMEAELLPAEGPAKIMTIGEVTTEEQQLADDFADDFNYYLTEVATEFYPDTSSMIMHLMYCGNTYKKIFRCPMRDRPVSESVSMLDLIVSDEATDLQNAIRVTHQFQMTRPQLRRMQIAGRYRDVNLGFSQAMNAPGHAALKAADGLQPASMRPQDVPYTLWETDVDLDILEHKIDGKWEREAPEGLPLAYKVTVDYATRQVLGIWRNWKDGDPLYRKRNMYVRYGLVPALGFHQWGFLHLLGNHTKALRAIWRLMIDAGMFSNFPGGVKLRGARSQTNELAPGPGEWVDVDAPPGATDIRQVLMAMPYKTIDAVYVQLAQIIEEGAQRLGGTVMLETGEGRTNVPVGTIMSMIEQQTQVMAGVHKRAHRSQKEELRKIRELFAENPQDLILLSRDPSRVWSVADAFMDLNLVPASDPNIPAHVHRIMQAWALMMVAQANPQLYDMRAVNMRVLRTIRVSQPDDLLLSPDQLAAAQANQGQGVPPDPNKLAALQQKERLAQQEAAQRAAESEKQAQTKLALGERQAQLRIAQAERQAQLKTEIAERQARQKAAELAQQDAHAEHDRQVRAQEAALESRDREADRESHERLAMLKEDTERIKLEVELAKHREAEESKRQTEEMRQQARRPMTGFDEII